MRISFSIIRIYCNPNNFDFTDCEIHLGIHSGTIFSRCNYKMSRISLDFSKYSPRTVIRIACKRKGTKFMLLQINLIYEHKNVVSLNTYLCEILYNELR